MAATLLWYDLETFGRNPAWDRIAQYAAVRTDSEFNPVGDPTVLYCRVSPDYLPDPEACLITGLTPQRVKQQGHTEAEFAARIHEEMSVPGTCAAGFNTVRFDDEFIRNLLYRNFYDPYRREYADNNSRWDLIDCMRMMHDLRPAGLNWLQDEEGKPVFKLGALSQANGISHEHAHDAVSDVYATLELARLAHAAQPKLFSYLFGLRKKEALRKLINLQAPEPLVLSSPYFTREGACSSVVFPVSAHPEAVNAVLVYDLRQDPRTWIDLEVDEIRQRVFQSGDGHGGEERVRFVSVHLNRCPALAPLRTLDEDRAAALGLDIGRCMQHAELLRANPALVQKVREVYAAGFSASRDARDPELQLYSGGFFGDEDRATFERIHASDPHELIRTAPEFRDRRGAELLRRFLARNHYDLLPAEEKKRWTSYCAARLLAPEIEDATAFPQYQRKVENMLSRSDVAAADKRVLYELREYGNWIERHVLSHR